MQTLQYKEYVKWSYKNCSRVLRSSDFSAFSMDMPKRLMNHVREYWYIGSMLAKSAMEKKRIVLCTAMEV